MKATQQFPKTLPAPSTPTTLITMKLIAKAVEGSRISPRKRIILPLHKGPESQLQRMINALQPGSYIQPHRHLNPPKAESILVVQGAILNFIFTDDGTIEDVQTIAAGSPVFGVDSDPGVFHTFLATARDTVIFEVKPGPYTQNSDKDFAPWSPEEGSAGVADYLEYLYSKK